MQKHVACIHPDQAKAGKAIGVPLIGDALHVLRNQIGKHDTKVFTYKGNAVDKAGTAAFKKALKRAGMKTLGGMIYATHGQAGTYKLELL